MTSSAITFTSRRRFLGGAAALSAGFALPACRASNTGLDAEVIVLGAGLSGLHAARLLASEGLDVLVVEASTRIGGRLLTLDHGEGAYTEGGGEQIAASYARILDTAHSLGVAVVDEDSRPRATSYHYKGQLLDPDAWKTLDTHPFAGPFKGASPASPLFRTAVAENPFITAADWRDASFSRADQSADDFLTSKGFDAQARRVIGHALNGNTLQSYSVMNLFRSLQLFSQARAMGPSKAVVGGAQRLPEAMAASLPRAPKLGFHIASIEVDADAVTVTARDGRIMRAAQCICALPFGALRKINVNAPITAAQTDAIQNLPYTQILQVHFRTDTPFWDVDGLPADMWTDGPLERIFMSRNPDGAPNGYGRIWINGEGADVFASKSAEMITESVKMVLSTTRPVLGRDIDVIGIQRWTRGNDLAGGAYMHWAPGQIERWASRMGQSAGRLHFAGEHLSYLHTGMEGAMESGENAAFAVLEI